MCKARPQEQLHLKTKPDCSCDFATFGIFYFSMFNLFELNKALKIPSSRINAWLVPGEAGKKGHFWSAGRLKKFVGVVCVLETVVAQ